MEVAICARKPKDSLSLDRGKVLSAFLNFNVRHTCYKRIFLRFFDFALKNTLHFRVVNLNYVLAQLNTHDIVPEFAVTGYRLDYLLSMAREVDQARVCFKSAQRCLLPVCKLLFDANLPVSLAVILGLERLGFHLIHNVLNELVPLHAAVAVNVHIAEVINSSVE